MDIHANKHEPLTISIKELLSYKNRSVKPIDGLNIPNITVPSHLVSKKRITEADNKLVIDIRQLFNSLTSENISLVKDKLRDAIIEKAKTNEMIKEIAEEILLNFLVSEQHIKNYIHLLNAISPMCVLMETNNSTGNQLGASCKIDCKTIPPQTIGNFFLNNCKNMIFDNISEKTIRSIAEFDLDNSDELDEYTKKREQIENLIITLCFLYDQRDTNNIKLKAVQLYGVLNIIFDNYKKNYDTMMKLGDPDDPDKDCENEEEYDILKKMCTIYASQLYTFMARSGNDFMSDKTIINGCTMADLVIKFQTEVIPTLTDSFLVSKCEEMKINA